MGSLEQQAIAFKYSPFFCEVPMNETETLEASRDKLVADFKVVVADAEELLKATAGMAGDRLVVARDRLAEGLSAARVRLDQADATMRERAREAARMTDDYVKANPWRAVGIGAGVGLILGLLLARN
jgi:ElaB/YqjD/DUF883 family membrane-anchored ribosome-binding protein